MEIAPRGIDAFIHSSNSNFTESSFGWFVVIGAGDTAATRGGSLSSGPPEGATCVAQAAIRHDAKKYVTFENFILT